LTNKIEEMTSKVEEMTNKVLGTRDRVEPHPILRPAGTNLFMPRTLDRV
jgi:hypothetical protein